jgi:hypothetical protein
MLHTEGPVPGVISLTIARRASSPGPHSLSNGLQHSLSGRDSVSSLLTSSSGKMQIKYPCSELCYVMKCNISEAG